MYSDHCANPPQLSCKCHIVEVHRNLQNDKVQTDFNAVRVDFHGDSYFLSPEFNLYILAKLEMTKKIPFENWKEKNVI